MAKKTSNKTPSADTSAKYSRTGFAKAVKVGQQATNLLASEMTNALTLTLANTWLGISAANPASTAKGGWGDIVSNRTKVKGRNAVQDDIQANTYNIDRYDTRKLWSVRIGDYFMPLSQSFTLRAKKRLNVSSLVDGIDIIQQTRKEAKTIDCSLRLTLRNNQPNLEIVKEGSRYVEPNFSVENLSQAQTIDTLNVFAVSNEQNAEAYKAMQTLSEFLQKFYEEDAIFEINNSTINDTFGVKYVFISEYKFSPRASAGTFQFDFSLTEVSFGDDVLTFDVREIGDA